jgi:hypothetical protein
VETPGGRPGSLSSWDVEEVGEWLETKLALGQHRAGFARRDIDGFMLSRMCVFTDPSALRWRQPPSSAAAEAASAWDHAQLLRPTRWRCNRDQTDLEDMIESREERRAIVDAVAAELAARPAVSLPLSLSVCVLCVCLLNLVRWRMRVVCNHT